MENMTTTNPLKLASNQPLDKLPDDDAMDIGVIEQIEIKPVQAKRSRSLTPSVRHTVKSRRLNFTASDPDEVHSITTQQTDPVIIDDNSLVDNIVDNLTSDGLDNCVLPTFDRYIYISQFKPETSSEKIKNFIVGKLKCKSETISCEKLISAKRDPSLPLSFVSFKIGASKSLAKKILKDGFWPSGLTAKTFEDRSKNANPQRQEAKTKNFRANPPQRDNSSMQQYRAVNNNTRMNHPTNNNNQQRPRSNNQPRAHSNNQQRTHNNNQQRPRNNPQPAGQRAMTWRVSRE